MSQANAQELTMIFPGLEEIEGQIMIRIKDDQGEIVKQLIQPVGSKQEEISVNLPQGRYAVSAFHDQNSNKKIDRAFTGMPKEPYGFSNNVRGSFGPPDLEDQLFELEADKSLTIELR